MEKKTKLQEELNDLRKQAQERKIAWDTYTLQFPLLLEIQTEEDFYALQRVNTLIPDDAWRNLTEFQQYTQKAKDLEQQISQIKPVDDEEDDEDEDEEQKDEEREEKAENKDNVPENPTDEKEEDPNTDSNTPPTNEIVSPDERQDIQIPDEEGVETPIPPDSENSIQNGQQQLTTENSNSDETPINAPGEDSLAEGLDADPRYKEIEEELKAKWQQENPNEENLSSNHQNYLLGSQDPNNANLPTLKTDAEALFKQRYPTDTKKYQAKERVRIYKNPNIDPAVVQQSQNILRATNLDPEVRNATKISGGDSNESIWQKIHAREQLFGWEKFAREYPEKARAYAESGHKELQHVLHTIEKSKENTIQADSQKNLTSENNQNESSAVSEIESLEPTQIETITEEETVTENPSIETETTEEENYPIHRPSPQTQMPQYNPQASRPVPIQQNNSTFGRFSPRQRLSNRFDVGSGMNNARRAKNRILGSSARKYLKLINTITNVIPQARIAKYVIFIVLIFIMFIVIAISGDSQLTSYDDYTQSDNSVTVPPGTDPNTPPQNPIPGLNLNLTGPPQILNSEQIIYTLEIQYSGTLEVTIINPIPTNATFVSATGTHIQANNAVTWRLSNNIQINEEGSSTRNYSFNLTLQPDQEDIEIINFFYATATQPMGSGSANLSAVLPTDLTYTEATDRAQQGVVNRLTEQNIAIYKQAAEISGVPWEVLAGIHYREGDLSSEHSLVSGRPIGNHEPDVMGNDGCSTQYSRLTENGNCVFDSLLNTALYAANLLKIKNGGSFPDNYQDLVKMLSSYNGGGNANCKYSTPYQYCPPEFSREDDSYPMNLLDAKHEVMYVVFCADYTLCYPPVRDQRTGALSAIMGIVRFYTQ
jgi:lysozyme family protein